MENSLPAQPSLEQLKKQAKDLLKDHAVIKPEALKLIRDHLPAMAGKSDAEIAAAPFALHDAQSVIARRYGFRSWREMSDFMEGKTPPPSAPEAPPDAAEKLFIALKARERSDYELLGSVVSPQFKALVPKEQFDAASNRLSTYFKADYRITYMGMVKQNSMPVYFWRLWVDGWDSDILIRMVLNSEGLISGLLYSPAFDSAKK